MRKNILCLLVAFTSQTLWASEYFLLPAATRLEGVGGVFGLAAGAENIFSERTKVVAGASLGQVQAAGIGVLDLPLGVENLGLNLGFANVQKAHTNSTYTRGLSQVNEFAQDVSATAYGATVDWFTFEKTLRLSVGLLLSEIHLDNYYSDGERITRPNKNGYHPIKTTSKIVRLDWLKSGIEKRQGFNLGVGLATAEGRIGQSDQLVTNWHGALYVPLAEPLTLALGARWSDAYLTQKDSRYVDATSVKAALATNCAAIANAAEQTRCQRLENSVADYVAQSNSYGTAEPIGGSNGLRAYDELSVRAAHTRVASVELRWNVTKVRGVDLALAPFYDLGWASDHNADVFKVATDSYGIGLRATYKSMPLRLAFAQARAQSAWFLALGQSF